MKGKDVFVVSTNREYKGVPGYNIEGVARTEAKATEIFGEWRARIVKEFCEPSFNGGVVIHNSPDWFVYDDHEKYWIQGEVVPHQCHQDLNDTVYVASIRGLSDGEDVFETGVYNTKNEAMAFIREQIECHKALIDTHEKYWTLEERDDSISLDHHHWSIHVFGWVQEMKLL